MSYNDLVFDFEFSPVLKTREQIQVTAHITVGGTGTFLLKLLIPGLSIQSAKVRIGKVLFAESESVANRWGLQFSSAEAALDPMAYESLTSELLAIASSDFLMKHVVVRRIIALSEPRPVSEQAPAVDTRTPNQIMFAELIEDISSIEELRKFSIDSRERFGELFADDDLREIALNMIEKRRTFLLNRRGE